MYSVFVLKSGYSKWVGPNRQQAAASITLVKGSIGMIVDTGLPTDRQVVLDGLKKYDMSPEQIKYVVCTCGQTDHVGNNNLFPMATFFVSYDISQHDDFTFFASFEEGQVYAIDDGLQIIPTPGHSGRDLSVLVDTEMGMVAVTGDLFESADDVNNGDLWRSFSEHPTLHEQSRKRILQIAHYIVPGHGDMFAVRGNAKQMRRASARPKRTINHKADSA